MSEQRTALVTGATGLVGNACLQFLLNSAHYSAVKVLTRRSLAFEHPKLEGIMLSDFDRLEEVTDLLAANDVFYCLGTTLKQAGSQAAFRKIDYEYALQIAKITLQNGAKQFLLVSSLGADAQSRIFYSRTKGELENEIKKMPFYSTHILQPSILLGTRQEQRFAEGLGQQLAQIINPLMLGFLRKYRGIKAEAVAKAMLHLALQNKEGVYTYLSDHIQTLSEQKN